MFFAPAGVHSVEHERPVLRLGAAGAGVEGKDRIAVVVFAREQEFETHALLGLLDLGELMLDFLGIGLVVLLDCHFGKRDGVLQLMCELFVFFHAVLQLLDLLQDLTGILLIVPEVLGVGLFFQLCCLFAGLVDAQRAAELLDFPAHFIQIIFCFFQCNDQDIVPPKLY